MTENNKARQAAGFEAIQEEEEPKEEGQEEGMQLSEEPEERMNQVAQALKEISPNAPSKEHLSKWKQMHGDIFILYLFDKAFIYRYLKRQEWVQMNSNPAFEEMKPEQIDDHIFERCVLWPKFSVQEKAVMPAGMISSLVEQVKVNSMFVPPERLAQLTIKL